MPTQRFVLQRACSFLPTSPLESTLKAWARFTDSFCPRIFCTLLRWQVLARIVPSLHPVYIPCITLLTDGPPVVASLNDYSRARKVCEVPCNKTHKHAFKFWTWTLLVFVNCTSLAVIITTITNSIIIHGSSLWSRDQKPVATSMSVTTTYSSCVEM